MHSNTNIPVYKNQSNPADYSSSYHGGIQPTHQEPGVKLKKILQEGFAGSKKNNKKSLFKKIL